METQFSKSWNEFIDSGDGKKCADIITLQASSNNQYLTNRLYIAFSAGWNANKSGGSVSCEAHRPTNEEQLKTVAKRLTNRFYNNLGIDIHNIHYVYNTYVYNA